MGMGTQGNSPASPDHYAIVDDGRVFTIALLSSLTWTFAAQNPVHHIRATFVTLLASMLLVYLLGVPTARLAYTLFGRKPKIARLVFMIVALVTVGAMAACN
jgi:hypothetical protein